MRVLKVLLVCAVVAGFGSMVFADGPSKKPEDPSKAAPTTKSVPAKGKATAAKGKGSFFVDVPADHYSAADLKFLIERGIITGLPSGEFQGSKPMLRYDSAVLLARTIRYLQNDPERVKAQELKVLQDLMFQLSQKIQTVEQKMDSLPAQGGSSAQVAELQKDLQSANQRIEELQGQIREIKVSTNTVDPAELEKVRKQANANFIIGIAGLFVGIVGIALATLLK